MKIYLCLLLIAFIACESVDKNDEIVLKASDFINQFYDKIVSIFEECKDDYVCYSEKFNENNNSLNFDQWMEYSNFLMSEECHDFCMDKLSKLDDTLKTQLCSACMAM